MATPLFEQLHVSGLWFLESAEAVTASLVPFTGATGSAAGVQGLVPAPPITTTNPRFLSDAGTWQLLNLSGIAVTSFNGRTGAVVPQSGDYSAAQVGAVALSSVNQPNGVVGIDASGNSVVATNLSIHGVSYSWPTANASGQLTNNGTGTLTFVPCLTVAQLGQPLGPASLDASGKLLAAQTPAIAISDTFVVSSQAAMLSLTAQTGDVAVRTDISTTFILQGATPGTLSNWVALQSPETGVASFNGRVGTVVPMTGDYTAAQITGLAAIASSGSASDLITGTISTSRLGVIGGLVAGTYANAAVTVDVYGRVTAIATGASFTFREIQYATAGQTDFTLTTMTTTNVAAYVDGAREDEFSTLSSTVVRFARPKTVGQKILFEQGGLTGLTYVPNSSLAAMASGTIKGNALGGASSPQDLTGAQVAALLPTFTTSANGLVPAPVSSTGKVLSDAGTWVTISISPFTTTTNGLVPAPGTSTGKVLSDAGTWVTNGSTSGTGTVQTIPMWATSTSLTDSIISQSNSSPHGLISITGDSDPFDPGGTVVQIGHGSIWAGGIITLAHDSGSGQTASLRYGSAVMGGNGLYLDGTIVSATGAVLGYVPTVPVVSYGEVALGSGVLSVGSNSTTTLVQVTIGDILSGNGLIQLPAGTDRTYGIAFGTDTFIYRASANLIQVQSTSGNGNFYVVDSTGACQAQVTASSTIGYFGTVSNSSVKIRTNATDAITIDTSQNISCGTPTGQHFVAASGGASGTTDGAAFKWVNAGTDMGYLGNKSAIVGVGAYSNTTVLYSVNQFEVYTAGAKAITVETNQNSTFSGFLTATKGILFPDNVTAYINGGRYSAGVPTFFIASTNAGAGNACGITIQTWDGTSSHNAVVVSSAGDSTFAGTVTANGGSATSVTTPAIFVKNDRTVTFYDSAAGVTNCGFLWCDSSNRMNIGAGNSTVITILPGGNVGIKISPVNGYGALQLPVSILQSGGISFAQDIFLYRISTQQVRLAPVSGYGEFDVSASTGETAYLYSTSADSGVGNSSALPFKIKTNSTTALTIDTSQNATFAGNVTMGRTSAISSTTLFGSASGTAGGACHIIYNSATAVMQIGNASAILGGTYDASAMVQSYSSLKFATNGASVALTIDTAQGLSLAAGLYLPVQNITAAAGTTTLDATANVVFINGSTTQTVKMPVGANGRIVRIYNNSTGTVTLQYNNGTGLSSLSSITRQTWIFSGSTWYQF